MAVDRSAIAALEELAAAVRKCHICEQYLPLGPRPILQVDAHAKILVAGQAPGRRVHESGVPFDDPSGDRLRDWMGISKAVFYDAAEVAILPMGFCYPGSGKSGDLPPRPECEKAWRRDLLDRLSNIRLTLVIGQYAHKWHLPSTRKNLTETVAAWKEFPPGVLPLPHPSPRNNIWLKKNPWFTESLLPALKESVREALQ